MFHVLENFLSEAEVGELRRLAASMTFVDGKSTNPDFSAKQNLQSDPRTQAAQSAAAPGVGRFLVDRELPGDPGRLPERRRADEGGGGPERVGDGHLPAPRHGVAAAGEVRARHELR